MTLFYIFHIKRQHQKLVYKKKNELNWIYLPTKGRTNEWKPLFLFSEDAFCEACDAYVYDKHTVHIKH